MEFESCIVGSVEGYRQGGRSEWRPCGLFLCEGRSGFDGEGQVE